LRCQRCACETTLWFKEWWSGEWRVCRRAEQRARRKSSCLKKMDGEGEAGLKLQPLGKRNLSPAQHNRLHQKTPTATDGGPRTLFSARTVSIKVAVLPIPSGDKPYHTTPYVITARDCDGLIVAKKYLMPVARTTYALPGSPLCASPRSTSQYHPSP
jgi:hypothetical protein